MLLTAASTPEIPKPLGATPNLDFEAFSLAGYFYCSVKNCYRPLVKNNPGIFGVGAAVYAGHPSTEILMLSYDLQAGEGVKLWLPGMPDPQDLLDHVGSGGLLESHNAFFEYVMWYNICFKKWGWPELKLEQQRCSMAKARSHALPGALDKLCKVLDTNVKKRGNGKLLVRKWCTPRKPSKANQSLRLLPEHDPLSYADFIGYNIDDSRTESEVSGMLPELSPFELKVWQTSQVINLRGVQVDTKSLKDCISILEQAEYRHAEELKIITGGAVGTIAELENLRAFTASYGVPIPNVQAPTVKEFLARDDLPAIVRRVLQIRQWLSSASVKKLNAIDRLRCSDDRLRDLFVYYGAATGRFAGSGAQPQNLANSGPKVAKCSHCGHYQIDNLGGCKWCGSTGKPESSEWCVEAVEDALSIIASRSIDVVEAYFGSALKVLSGCMRGLFIAKEGHDLVGSDYSAIEAVVAAEVAREPWRQEVFRTHGKIYESGASKITGVPLQEFFDHKEKTGSHHPLRKSIGKVSELASIYGGWINAWKVFGADKYFKDDKEIRDSILKWRAESPNIVEMWGGQVRRKRGEGREFYYEFFGLEGCAVLAILNPGTAYTYNDITYIQRGDVLYCKLISGRNLVYHRPLLRVFTDRYSKKPIYQITFEGWNSDSSKGPVGWMRRSTRSGKLFENVIQALARDILVHALIQLEAAGYKVVLHVHDEIIVEVQHGRGSIEEVEKIMSTMPEWCESWPVRAAGGWRGRRFRKD